MIEDPRARVRDLLAADDLRQAHEVLLEMYQAIDGPADEMSSIECRRAERFFSALMSLGLNPYAEGEQRFPDRRFPK